MTSRSKADAQMARAATTLGIGVVGLVIVRLIVQSLPMFQEAGWIVKGKGKMTTFLLTGRKAVATPA